MEEPPDYDDVDGDGKVLVFRGSAGTPVAVPTDVATMADRCFRAHQARVGGKSWHQIALDEQWPSAEAAAAEVRRYMAEAAALVVEASQREMLQLEVARLDALQSALWPQAMAGHVPSATAVLSIIVNRSKIVGLDPDKMNDDAAQQARTVVVPSEPTSYLDALKKAAEQASPAAAPAVPSETPPPAGGSSS